MPKNPLLVYVRDHLTHIDTEKKSGPVITISREYGCPGYTIANMLADKINEIYNLKPENRWKAVDKQILQEASKELELPEELIRKVAKQENKGIFADMFQSTSYIPNDIKVKKKIAQIIVSLAHQGNIIIIGRGSSIITSKMKNSLHIFLYASKEWRIERVMAKENINEWRAREMLEAVDRERIYLRSMIAGEEVTHHNYDVCFNVGKLKEEDILNAITSLAQSRKLLPKPIV